MKFTTQLLAALMSPLRKKRVCNCSELVRWWHCTLCVPLYVCIYKYIYKNIIKWLSVWKPFNDVLYKAKLVLKTHIFCKIFHFLYRSFISLCVCACVCIYIYIYIPKCANIHIILIPPHQNMSIIFVNIYLNIYFCEYILEQFGTKLYLKTWYSSKAW